MTEPNQKLRVLVVDDHPTFLVGIEATLENECAVKTARTAREAITIMREEMFDCALFDVDLKGQDGLTGFDLVRWCLYQGIENPTIRNMALTVTSCSLDEHRADELGLVNGIIEKTIGGSFLLKKIQEAVGRRRMSPEIIEKRRRILGPLLAHQSAIRLVGITAGDTKNGGYEKFEGILASDGKPIGWDAYNYRMGGDSEEDKVKICLASTVGCIGGCLPCLSRKNPFERQLTVSELIAQPMWAITAGYHAKDLFSGGPRQLRIHITDEGEFCSNQDNCCQAIEQMTVMGTEGIALRLIVTSLCLEGPIRRFREKYIHLPVVFYWSLHSMIPEIREEFLPATRGQSLIGIRDALCDISGENGQTNTIAWMVITGGKYQNNRPSDVELLRNFIKDLPFEMKISPPRDESVPGAPPTTKKDMDDFGKLLTDAGLPYRMRMIVGDASNRAGCGYTVPHRNMQIIP